MTQRRQSILWIAKNRMWMDTDLSDEGWIIGTSKARKVPNTLTKIGLTRRGLEICSV